MRTSNDFRFSEWAADSKFWWNGKRYDFPSMALQLQVGQDFGASRLYSGAPQSVELLWTIDQPVAETSTWQHPTVTPDRYHCHPAGFEPAIPTSERPQTYATMPERAEFQIFRIKWRALSVAFYTSENLKGALGFKKRLIQCVPEI